MDARFRFTRLVRTQSSEIYLIWEEENRVGQLDLHYQGETIYATMILETDLSVTSEEELLTQIDDDVVASYLPSFDRTDFVVTVFRGEEISSYTDSGSMEPEDDGEH
ncbi:MAG: hypothetical protein K0Q72_4404 [Armatimonadetes bacterium]|jgi:hypothetical protein|nr:hypothetical protein [Armatimonadota bacterium]